MAVSVALYQTMFLYSGINKVRYFSGKVQTLQEKLKQRFLFSLFSTPRLIAECGMAGAILLEIFGSLFLAYVAFQPRSSRVRTDKKWKTATKIVLTSMIAFVILATYLYHFHDKRAIPTLSNLTTTAGFVLMWHALGV